jgi:hypothetical protein
VSIHADDEFNLRLALDGELDDVTPRAGLADLVIARYRKSRRRRFAGVVGLFVVFVGIGVPAGIASTSGGATDGAAGRAGSPGVCVLMFFMPPTRPGRAGPAVPRGATQVTVGRYRAWFAPPGYLPSGDGAALVRPALAGPALVIEGEGRDLVIGASGLPRSALVSLVSAGLSAA